jgi:signal transduction histidine kinase/ligand-binding sensor domain-containing protein
LCINVVLQNQRKGRLEAFVTSRFKSIWNFLLNALALMLAFLSAHAASRAGDYLVDVWTSENGLPDSSVAAIAQTPEGYLWIGTYNGLARFDGVRFVTFDPANTPALAHAGVRKLSVDNQGTLWINTFDGSLTSLRQGIFAREWTGAEGLGRNPDVTLVSSGSNEVTFVLRYGELRRRPQTAPAGANWEDLVPTNRMVGALCVVDGEGTIWYRGSDLHLSRLKGKDFEPLPPSSGLKGNRVNCLTVDPHGRLWVGTDKDIAMWDGNRFQTVTPTDGELEVNVEFLSIADDGRLWAGVDGHVREALGRRWILEAESTTNVFTRTFGGRMGTRQDHHGGVWLYDYGLGLSHITANGQVRRFGAPDGFAGERVNCFFEDHEGNWWMGLDAGGLVRIRERRFQTIGTSGQVLPTPARSVCEETNGTLWVGTLGDGLVRCQGGVLTNLTISGGAGKGFVFCVCPDVAGRLWVSAGNEDLYVYETNEFRLILPTVHGVKAIYVDQKGRIWAGTHSGIYFADSSADTRSNNFKLYKGTGSSNVRALAEDRQGNLWAGCDDGALLRITGDTVATLRPTDSKGSQAIWSLLAEDDGTVWSGTFRGGLLRFRNGKFTRFSINEGLPNNIICQILPDATGNLWLGSHQGIFRVAKSALNDFARGESSSIPVTTFGRSDGLPSLDCSGGYQPAAWRGQDGRLWFTTLKGAVSVQPEEISPNPLPPTVVIEEIVIDGKSLDATAKMREKPVRAGMFYDHDKKFLKLPPGKYQFEFHYTGLSLISSDRVRFRYRLEGAGDINWVDAGTRRSVQYSLLPPGIYRFHVIACNSDNKWNELGDSLTLEILPHFYDTLSFRILVGLVGAGLVAGAVWYSVTRRLHRKLEHLARQQGLERERARIAKDIHDDLGANLTLIARLGHLARQEKTVERIEKMENTARQAIKSLDEIVWAVNPRNDTLAHLIDYTGQFATDYLYAAGVRCLLDVPEQVPPLEVPSNVRHNVFLVAKEALQNIVKHANATEVWLRINATNLNLKIVIEDNGCGFEEKPEDPLADGLRNMQQRMNEIGGHCQVRSRAGRGTEISIETPLAAI